MPVLEPPQAVFHASQVGLGRIRSTKGIHVETPTPHVVDLTQHVVDQQFAVRAHAIQQGSQDQAVHASKGMVCHKEYRPLFRNAGKVAFGYRVSDPEYRQPVIVKGGITPLSLLQQIAVGLIQLLELNQRIGNPGKQSKKGLLPGSGSQIP